MAESIKTTKDISFTANILAKQSDGMFVAHCLELDIVAVAETLEDVRKEMVSLICAQIDYAFSNDNIENLFHPAPPEVWQEFYKCKDQVERKYPIRGSFQKKTRPEKIVPPWLITKTCNTDNNLCHA